MKATAVWHDDLVHINKVRDNHVIEFSRRFDLELVVASDAEIGPHVSAVASVIRAPRIWSRRPFLHVYWALRSLRFGGFDLIIGLHGSEPAALGLAKWLGRPVIQDVWDLPGASVDRSLTSRALSLYGAVIRRALVRSNLVLAAAMLRIPLEAEGVSPDRIIDVPNGMSASGLIEIQDRAAVESSHSPKHDSPISVVYAGRLAEARGGLVVASALDELAQRGFAVQFGVIGEVDDLVEARLRAVGDAHEQLVDLRFHGVVGSTRVAGLLASAEIGLCLLDDVPQYRWAYPIKAVEYAAAGLVTVATDLPGTRSQAAWIGPRAGATVFVESTDPARVADALIEASRRSCPAGLMDHCTWSQVMSSVLDEANEQVAKGPAAHEK